MAHNASGQGWLIPMVGPVADACGETPEQVPADANYSSERELEERDIDGHPAPAGEGKAAAADPEPHPEKARTAETLASPEGRRRHARRKWMAEAAAGWIKQATGFRRLSFRGLQKLEAEWIPVCLALNVRRLHTLQAA
ncbi:MAG: transposase [Gammaproteobacteria bacterium]|nr:transposase [Gammaproteobacteria bacterium]